MCQSENAIQLHMPAITVSGNQPDVGLVCQMLVTTGGCSKTCPRSIYILDCVLLRIGMELQRTALSLAKC